MSFEINRIPYIGHPSNGNMGDEILFRLCQDIFNRSFWKPWTEINYLKDWLVTLSTKSFIVGGGSLLFTQSTYQKINRWTSLGKIPILFGTGSRELDSLSHSDFIAWKDLLECPYKTGVRGTLTKERFELIGLEATVIGDPGFMLSLKIEQPITENYIVVCPRLISSPNLSKIDSSAVLLLHQYLMQTAEDTDVVLFASAPEDVAVCELLAKATTRTKVTHYRTNLGLVDNLSLLTKAKLVVTMRMHPGLFAMCGGTPVIFLENRSKYFDALSLFPDLAIILDPLSTELEELQASARCLVHEQESVRKDRWMQVREVAQNQIRFFAEIKETSSI